MSIPTKPLLSKHVVMSQEPDERLSILLGVHSLCAGGTERVVSTLLNVLDGFGGFNVHCVLYGRQPNCFYTISESVTIHFPEFDFDSLPRGISIVKTVAHIRSVVRRVRPAVFLNFGERWNNLALLSVQGLKIATVVADRSCPDNSLGIMHDSLRKFLYARSHGIVTQTSHAAECLSRIVPATIPVHVIPNPLFTVTGQVVQERRREVLFVGRLIPTKHVDRLIRIFKNSYQNGWVLTIVGGDAQGYSELKRLKELVSSEGLQDCVNLEGERKDVQKYYRRASIFAFSSSSEGFPNALTEALYFGLPSVAYDCSAGPADLITNGQNGFLIPLHDEVRFACCLRQLMLNDDMRNYMGKEAANSVAHLTPGRIGLQFLHACGIYHSTARA